MGLDFGDAGMPRLSACTVRGERLAGVLDRADDFGFAIEAILAFECAGNGAGRLLTYTQQRQAVREQGRSRDDRKSIRIAHGGTGLQGGD